MNASSDEDESPPRQRRSPRNKKPRIDYFTDNDEESVVVRNKTQVTVVTPEKDDPDLFSSGSEGVVGDEDDVDLFSSDEDEIAAYYRPAPTAKKTKTTKSENMIGKSNDSFEVLKECTDDFILKKIFGTKKVKVYLVGTKTQKLEKERDGLQLITTKLEDRYSSSHYKYDPLEIKAFYVKGTKKYVKKTLEKFGKFHNLWDVPLKLGSRMELLVSPACNVTIKGEATPCIFGLKEDDLELIGDAENATMGCGFVPSQMLLSLLGEGTQASQASAVQCRVVCPRLGIFKGMLVSKPNISKIQLPLSMRKVEGANPDAKGPSFLLFNSIVPSKVNVSLERYLNPNLKAKPRKSDLNELKGLSDRMCKLLIGAGVPGRVIDDYMFSSKSWEGLKHASLSGVADCTNYSLPEGHVFIPGLPTVKEVIVTRSPFTSVTDLRLLPTVTKKPRNMSSDDWAHLNNLSFGIIIFAAPKSSSSLSTPEIVNNSDLDGDRFITIWDKELCRTFVQPQIRDNDVPTTDNAKNGESTYAVGDLVRAKWGNGLYYDGKVAKVCGKDSYDIDFDDGDKKKAVPLQNIKAVNVDDICETSIVVLEHRGTNKNIEIKINYVEEEGVPSWKLLSKMKSGLYAEDIAEYAIQNDLLETPGWEWAQQYCRDAEMVEIQIIFKKRGEFVATVLYDDGSEEDQPITDIDIDILNQYYKKHSETPPQSISQRIEKAKKKWFDNMQEQLSDLTSLYDRRTLLQRLHSEYINKDNGHSPEEVEAFAKAYKLANDLPKHGGRVPLPSHLRDTVVKKKPRLHDFIVDEDE